MRVTVLVFFSIFLKLSQLFEKLLNQEVAHYDRQDAEKCKKMGTRCAQQSHSLVYAELLVLLVSVVNDTYASCRDEEQARQIVPPYERFSEH